MSTSFLQEVTTGVLCLYKEPKDTVLSLLPHGSIRDPHGANQF